MGPERGLLRADGAAAGLRTPRRMAPSGVDLSLVIPVHDEADTVLPLLGEIRRETVDQANLAQEGRLKTFWTLLKTKGDEFRVENDQLYAGDYLINGNFELPDKIKEIFGGTVINHTGPRPVPAADSARQSKCYWSNQ